MEIIRRETDYAARALVQLALTGPDRPLSARAIAEAQGTPLDFTHKFLRAVSRVGMVTSSLGTRGGFTLAKAPSEITLLDIMQATQGPVRISNCVFDPSACPRTATCTVTHRLASVQRDLERVLSQTTLADLIGERPGTTTP